MSSHFSTFIEELLKNQSDANEKLLVKEIFGNKIYFGGNDISFSRIVNVGYFDTENNSFNTLPKLTNIDGSVNAIELDNSGNIYIGGEFNRINDNGEINYNNIAKYNITNEEWEDISNGVANFNVNTLEYDNINNVLYVGGENKNEEKSNENIKYINYTGNGWNTWNTLKTNDIVNDIKVHHHNGSTDVYVGGNFTQVTHKDNQDIDVNTDVSYVAYYNTNNNEWREVKNSDNEVVNVDGKVSTIEIIENNLYLYNSFIIKVNLPLDEIHGGFDDISFSVDNDAIRQINKLGRISFTINDEGVTDASVNEVYLNGRIQMNPSKEMTFELPNGDYKIKIVRDNGGTNTSDTLTINNKVLNEKIIQQLELTRICENEERIRRNTNKIRDIIEI